MPRGYVCLVLHAHLPFVRHPEHEVFMEEDWLYEAMTETYIPLLTAFRRLRDQGVDFRITMSMTPPLVSMLDDELLRSRYVRHMTKLIELAGREVIRTKFLPEFNALARRYLGWFTYCFETFEAAGRDLCGAFRDIQDSGNLEVITCGATHGFLPFMNCNRVAQRAQVRVARNHYASRFGRSPRGIWIAECAYQKGVDSILREEGIEFFFTDAHGVLFGEPRPKYGVYAPVLTPSGVAVFARDLESSQQVWSSVVGYPGHPAYREFYRDIGYDLDFEYIKPYIHPDGIRINTGIKYHRITEKTVGLREKAPYDWDAARVQARIHARDFVQKRCDQVRHLANHMRVPPIVVSPYDAELFGHWWYEGPVFIEEILRIIATEVPDMGLITPSEYLRLGHRIQPSQPCDSTWGAKGYNEVWLDSSNDWIYRHLIEIAIRMESAASLYPDAIGLLEKALNQMARELLLAQSSDWAFIMKTNTTVGYASKRTRIHVDRFLRLHEMVVSGRVSAEYLGAVTERDNIFPDIDYRVYIDPEKVDRYHG